MATGGAFALDRGAAVPRITATKGLRPAREGASFEFHTSPHGELANDHASPNDFKITALRGTVQRVICIAGIKNYARSGLLPLHFVGGIARSSVSSVPPYCCVKSSRQDSRPARGASLFASVLFGASSKEVQVPRDVNHPHARLRFIWGT